MQMFVNNPIMIPVLLFSFFLLTSIPPPSAAQELSCPGFLFNDDCYFVVEGRFTRAEAEEACGESAKLAYIKTRELFVAARSHVINDLEKSLLVLWLDQQFDYRVWWSVLFILLFIFTFFSKTKNHSQNRCSKEMGTILISIFPIFGTVFLTTQLIIDQIGQQYINGSSWKIWYLDFEVTPRESE